MDFIKALRRFKRFLNEIRSFKRTRTLKEAGTLDVFGLKLPLLDKAKASQGKRWVKLMSLLGVQKIIAMRRRAAVKIVDVARCYIWNTLAESEWCVKYYRSEGKWVNGTVYNELETFRIWNQNLKSEVKVNELIELFIMSWKHFEFEIKSSSILSLYIGLIL